MIFFTDLPSATVVPSMGNNSQTVAARSNLAGTNSPTGQKLHKAAAEFESMLLSNLWKSMKSSFAPEEEDSSDPAHDTLDDWGIQAMAGAVGKAGGLGLGELILKHLEPLLHSQDGKEAATSDNK